MTMKICGLCARCGAPVFTSDISEGWWSVYPPRPQMTCACFDRPLSPPPFSPFPELNEKELKSVQEAIERTRKVVERLKREEEEKKNPPQLKSVEKEELPLETNTDKRLDRLEIMMANLAEKMTTLTEAQTKLYTWAVAQVSDGK